MATEKWKVISDFPSYEVSDQGQIRNKRTREFKSTRQDIGSDSGNVSKCLHGQFETVKGYHLEYADKKTSFLYPHQLQAIDRMFTGCILNGGVGSGKSRAGLFYYFKENDGWISTEEYIPMRNPKDLYVITTAMKRDKKEWEGELAYFLMSTNPEVNYYNNKIVVDSWNNIKKYTEVKGAFFILDEDRVCGSGAWVKAFYKIAKANEWIILSATSGDCWSDYIPVFIANGFYKNKTEFTREHCIYSRYTKYPKIDRYVNTGRLVRLRNKILIDMDFSRSTVQHHEDVYVKYDILKYKEAIRTRSDPFNQGYFLCTSNNPEALLVGRDILPDDVAPIFQEWYFEPEDGQYVALANKPIQQASGLCYTLRRIVNEDEARQSVLMELAEKHPRMIVFYNFDYEREILLNLYYGEDVEIAEWSGHAHQPVPESEKWIYLTQYTAGCEGWNSIKTDTIVFYSQNYSYKVMTQAAGRIDRLNTPFLDLYYYHFKSRSGIDLAISKALSEKRQFNENRWVKW